MTPGRVPHNRVVLVPGVACVQGIVTANEVMRMTTRFSDHVVTTCMTHFTSLKPWNSFGMTPNDGTDVILKLQPAVANRPQVHVGAVLT